MLRSSRRLARTRVVCDVFDADGVRAAMADASPEAAINQLTALPPRLHWGNPDVFDANNRVRTEGTRIFVDAALAAGASRVVAQSIAFAYAPTGDRVKEEDAALFTEAPPPLGGVVAAVVEHEQLVTGTAGIDGLVLRYGMLYGPGTYHDRRGSTAADIVDDEPAPQPEWLPVLARALECSLGRSAIMARQHARAPPATVGLARP